jgi:hypothetical protein
LDQLSHDLRGGGSGDVPRYQNAPRESKPCQAHFSKPEVQHGAIPPRSGGRERTPLRKLGVKAKNVCSVLNKQLRENIRAKPTPCRHWDSMASHGASIVRGEQSGDTIKRFYVGYRQRLMNGRMQKDFSLHKVERPGFHGEASGLHFLYLNSKLGSSPASEL